MRPQISAMLIIAVGGLATWGGAVADRASACSRILYVSPSKQVITGRSMEWSEDQRQNLWIFPRGIARSGATLQNPLAWTSKYGSVVTSAYDVATADGINEKGLDVNVLFLDSSDYGARDAARPGIALSLWAQYYLDNFATVADAVAASRAEPFQLVTMSYGLTRTYDGQMHISMADATGDSAVFEYLKGKLVIHHGAEFTVMMNEPSYDEQLAALKRSKIMGGNEPIPNGLTDDDRFQRAAYYLARTPDPADERQAIAIAMSISRNLSVPYSVNSPDSGRWSGTYATIYRTIADSTNRLYFYESTLSPDTIWVDLSKLDFSAGAPVKELPVSDDKIRVGDVSGDFVDAKPFTFLPERPKH